MNVHVERNRFLSVACEPGERIVFDRKETRYHLLRDTAARLWDEIGEGGTFELSPAETGAEDPVSLLIDAGLLEPTAAAGEGVTRRVWLRRTGKASAAALVLPLVATISAPQLALGQGPSLDERTDLDQTKTEETNTEQTNTEQTNFTHTNPGPSESPQILESSSETLDRQRRRQQHYEEKLSQPPRKKNQGKGRGRRDR